MLRNLAGPQPVMLGPEALHRRQWWRAILTLSLGIVLAWTLSALYAAGLIRMLGVEAPLWQTPELFLPFGLVSLILTAGIVWLANWGDGRGRLGQFFFYVISGVAPGVAVNHGIRMLSRYRSAMKLHRQLA